MTVNLYRHFNPLEKLPADWPDAAAGFLAGVSNINLIAKTPTSVAVSAATQPRSVLAVDGFWRWAEVDVEAAVPAGAATTYDVVATCTPNKFKAALSETEGETDETNYAFAIEVRAHGTLPTIGGEIAAAQKIGEVDWNGAAIAGLRQTVGHHRSTDPTEPTMLVKTLPAVIEKDIAEGEAPIRKTEALASTRAVWEVLSAGTRKLRVLASGLVEGLTLPAETVPTEWLQNLSVTAAKLGAQAVETGKIKLEAITTALIANLAVTTAKIAEGAVTAAKLGAEAVETAAIKALSVTTAKIAEGAVTEPKIAEGAVARSKLAELIRPLQMTSKSTAYTAAPGDLVLATAALTVTLPAATANPLVGVLATSGEVTVTRSGTAKISGDFVSEAESIKLTTNQHVVLQADGTNWWIAAGEPKREQVYGAQVERTENAEYEASATRMTFVMLEVTATTAEAFWVSVAVGNVTIGILAGTANEGGDNPSHGRTLPFIVPPGAKWRITRNSGTLVYKSSYLSL
ncbi:MAG: hypothetical protein KGL39_38200 [Patescibacteria group bacterium]|nr:hypothetical protein [Patescibacteria group bacterium]